MQLIRCFLTLCLLAGCDGLGAIDDATLNGAAQKSTRDDDGDGYSPADGDCDDDDEDVNPGERETCDDVDNDCDDLVDDDDPNRIGRVWMFDGDGDGYGYDGDDDSYAEYVTACDPEEAYSQLVENTGGDADLLDSYVAAEYDEEDEILVDCNDEDADVNPGQAEVCDGLDNDCDDVVDDGVSTPTVYYADADGDDYGDADTTQTACETPDGYVDDDTDCDDDDADVNPGQAEVCDSADVDEDCDGDADDDDASADATTMTAWYLDSDDDSYGGAWVSTSCDNPSSAVLVDNDEDCDDTDAAINPGATEVCDSADNDCDDVTDPDDSAGAGTWYADADSDSYGDAGTSSVSCSAPSGYVSDATDCNDGNSAINPGATEVCDSADVDEDCDSASDDADASTADASKSTFYADADSDAYGDASSSTLACSTPSGYVSDATDCNDGNASVNPSATETCNEVDDNCDGDTDEGVETTFYADDDSDAYGDADSTASACEAPSGYVSDATDCDDTDDTVYPSAPELCDDQDNDCDDNIDESAVDKTTWSRDRDDDGYGDSDVTYASCDAPSGYVATGGDCDDDDEDVNPGATEVFNEVDDDCDDEIDEGTSCELVIDILNDGGLATSIVGEDVSDNDALEGEWYPTGVSGVDVTATSLGGDDWWYDIVMDLCVTSSGFVIVDAAFEDGSSLCESNAATGLVYATMDETDLDVAAYDNLDGTCSTIITR
ncbi:putative metal-binding motif-containing protein [Candidatus Uhrbacteria bacterium]|nr:putative metal-binding motif-containing protein [Candidatus Uhrbacteria bacterium]